MPRGRPRKDARDDRIARLEPEKRQLEQELVKARFVVEVQAKLHALVCGSVGLERGELDRRLAERCRSGWKITELFR